MGVPRAREGGGEQQFSTTTEQQLPGRDAVTAALRICPRHRAGAAGHLGQSRAAHAQIPGSGGLEEGSRKIGILSVLGNLLKIFFWEVKGLVVVSILLLTAVPWGNEEDKIAGTEG